MSIGRLFFVGWHSYLKHAKGFLVLLQTAKGWVIGRMKIIFEVEGEYNILDKTGRFLLGQVISSAESLGILVSAWKQVMWLETGH